MSENIRVSEKKSEASKEERTSHVQKSNYSQPVNSSVDRILFLQRTIGNQAIGRLIKSGALQAKLKIGQPGDKYEQEADMVADQVMRMPEPQIVSGNNLHIQRACLRCEENELKRQPIEEEEEKLQRKTKEEDEKLRKQPVENEEEKLQAKTDSVLNLEVDPGIENQIQSMKGGGNPLSEGERAFFEPRFGVDFSQVRVHADSEAAEAARGVNARAFTLGHDVVFGVGEYAPGKCEGKRLLGHELTHFVQQHGEMNCIQRTIGDGHDLISPRFSLLEDLEAAYDGETVIQVGSSGRGVQAIQQSLYDLGHSLPASGADGKFGSETKAAVQAYQRANPPLVDDGKVGKNTMKSLDARFGTPVLPTPAARSAPWTDACVRSILCPWSPHTIDVLKTRITLKSFDSIGWTDEMWNGTAWIPAPFPGGGYNTGTEIGVLNSSCESMSETLYHEVLHAEQPTRHRTTKQRESYAYRIGEEFSIAMGLGGRPDLRSTDVQGREYADPTKVEAFVAVAYPSVPAGGGGDEIIGKAATFGHVRVRRPDTSVYTRPAVVGEKVQDPNPPVVVNEVTHPTAGWTCP